MKKILSLLLITFAILGLIDSSLITHEEFKETVPICGDGFNCNEVLNSKWSHLGPIPLSILGMFFYALTLTVAIANYNNVNLSKRIKKITKQKNLLTLLTTSELLLILTMFGALFSIYLVSIMEFVIHSWCRYCLISAFSSISLFITASFYYTSYCQDSPFIIKKFIFTFIHFNYINFIKPIFFLFDAELMHDTHTKLGKTLGSYRILRTLTALVFNFSHHKLSTQFNKINFPNPIGLAGGFDYNADLNNIIPSVGFGFHTIGTVTLHSYQGNQPPRLARFPNSKSLLVNKGLKTIGAKKIIKKLKNQHFSIPTGISIGATNKPYTSTKEQILDIITTFKLFEQTSLNHSYYELNISCPNTFGGEPFTSPTRLQQLLNALDKLNIKKPIYIKMPIDQTEKETLKMLKIINKSSIAGVIFGNLTKDKKNPNVTKKDRVEWQKISGNLSGKPTWHRSNQLIKLTKKYYPNRFTIIGTGGIFTPKDAEYKLKIGADLIQIITGMIFEGPQTIGNINHYLAKQAMLKNI